MLFVQINRLIKQYLILFFFLDLKSHVEKATCYKKRRKKSELEEIKLQMTLPIRDLYPLMSWICPNPCPIYNSVYHTYQFSANGVPPLASVALAWNVWYGIGCIGPATLPCGSSEIIWFDTGSLGLHSVYIGRFLANGCLVLSVWLFLPWNFFPHREQWRMAGDTLFRGSRGPIHLKLKIPHGE